MTLPGPIPSHPTTPLERVAHLERRVRAMQSAPKRPVDRDAALYGDALFSCPRALVQNNGVSLSLNVPRAVLMYASMQTAPVNRMSFAIYNSNVSASSVSVSVYIGTDPTLLALWGAGQTAIADSVSDEYDVALDNTGVLPVGYVLAVVQATAVGATVPMLNVCGQAPLNVFRGKDRIAGPLFTNMVGSTSVITWPGIANVSTANSAAWSASFQTPWLALGN